uniref:Uncharacterized protein n=1 Tax=Arundo donax TaxID=35708 RepID=A0A0A8YW17_ARUDO
MTTWMGKELFCSSFLLFNTLIPSIESLLDPIGNIVYTKF